MHKKIYMIYNKRTERLTGEIFLCYNDREAEYNYSIYIQNSKEKNKYFMENDFQLTCLGILWYEKLPEINKLIGIKVPDEYPYLFDEIKDGWKPNYEQNTTEDISSDKIKFDEMQKEYRDDLKSMKGIK